MEEEAEKMAALKRAYADIILNTAKESAARVLAAERRALGFQQSLFAAKEDAVAAMVRLKAIMEDKIREAEKEALYQAKKIDELELQLGEAEDTIVDLREDLKKVREELMIIKNGSVWPLSEGNINEIFMASKNVGKETSSGNLNGLGNMPIISNNMTSLTQKTTDTDLCCLRNAEKAEYPKEFSEGESPGNTDLASIIWRKVPELYRKGYTQRIHALEHDLISSKGPDLQIPCKTDSAISDNRTTQVKDALMFKVTEEEIGFCHTVDTEQEPGCSGKVYSISSDGFSSPRKKRMINNQSNAFPDGIFSDELKSCIISSKFTVHDNWNETEAPKETRTPFIGETTEDRKCFAEISAEKESLMLNRCRLDASIKMERMEIKQCSKGITCQNFQKQNQSVCEDKFLQNSLSNSEYANDRFLERTFSIEEDVENRREVAIDSKEEEENLTENSDDLKTETKDIANGTAQTGTDKFLKYTFQRKRKKEFSPTKNEINFAEKKPTLKPKSVDKQNSVPVSSKSSLATDLPRDNRRLVQVARQLISLSEKRW